MILKPKKEKPRTEPEKKGLIERIMTKIFGEVKIPEYSEDTEESEDTEYYDVYSDTWEDEDDAFTEEENEDVWEL